MTDVIQNGNIGVKIVVNVVDENGDPRNLTGATNLKIKLRSVLPSQKGKSFTATAENLSQGSLSYTTVAGNIDALGEWKVQAYYELNGWQGHTKPEIAFQVEDNLA